MVHLHRHHTADDSSDDEHHDHHVSIASLRSKFENLAHASHAPFSKPAAKPSTATPSTAVATASLSPVPPRVSTPVLKAATPPPGPPQVPTTRPPPVLATKPVVIPKPESPVSGAPPASNLTKSPSPPLTREATARPRPAALPVPSAVRPPAPPPPPKAVSPSPPSTTAETSIATIADTRISSSPQPEDQDTQSVQALRQRFGQALAPRPPLAQQRPTTDVLLAAKPAVTSQPALAECDAALAPQPLPSKAAPPPTMSKPLSASPASSVSSLVASKPPPPKPPISRTNSPAPDLASAQLVAVTAASPSRSDSPVGGHRPAPPPPVSRSQLAPSPSPAGSRSSSPSPALGHRPAPPPPRPISPSPLADSTPMPPAKPPLPVRKATLPGSLPEGNLNGLSAPELVSGPPRIPANRPKSASTASSTSQPAVAPPPLPQTKRPVLLEAALPPVTVTAPSSGPPPLPKTARPTDSAAPQPLPTAKRPDTQATPAPRLPTRRPTLDSISLLPPPSAPPLPGNKPAAPTLARPPPEEPTTRPRALSAAAPPPVAFTPPRLPTRRGSTNVPAGEEDSYRPPPPPLRSVVVAATIASGAGLKRANSVAATGASLGRSNSTAVTLHRNGTTRGTGATTPRRGASGGDSDDDEEGGAGQLTTMAQRLLDEHPDSTQANRRPPQFSPHIKIPASHSITAFASYGRYACVAHTTIKIFDTQNSCDTPVLTFDLKDAGLETRSKEPRITALGFRPTAIEEEKGRFLWCGSKDGHLWEIDILTGDLTATKPGIHGSAVTHIMHYKQLLVTLDDVGKLHVWERPAVGGFRVKHTTRISDKVTFAKMIKGQLWTATAPAVRSTTNAAGVRGPTVRVYDLTVFGSLPPPLVALTTEWTGAATSATVMPLGDMDKVYIGHEGGFVSIWSTTEDQLVCDHVLKVSSTDILSLEGAGERLWAGNRRGQIHVWNIAQKPWLTTNIWTAHDEQPIHTLAVNPSAIAAQGRFMLWSVSRDSAIAWDGLLAVDWIDKKMAESQPRYCDFRDVRVLVCSWNIDSSKPTDLIGSTENTTFLDQVLNSVDSPDIIVFGFQEVVPLTDKKLTAKTLLFGHKGKDGGGATNDRVSERYRAWAEKLTYAVRLSMPQDTPYVKVHSEQLVGLFSCIFVKQSEREALRDVNITTVKRGIGGIYGNKGAIVARMVIDDTSMCFINVHLAAGQSHRAARTADLAAIMEDKAIFPAADKMPYVNGGSGTGILDHEMVVLNGDLNYRIDQRREVVVSSIRSGDLDFLLEHDQLRKEMRGNHAFRLRNFAEAPINFAPTYKYDPGTNNYDSSDKRRIPAWCDRILFLKSPRVTPLSYQRYEITCSDHKPISAALSMQVKRINPDLMRATYKEVVQEWSRREGDILSKIEAAYAALY